MAGNEESESRTKRYFAISGLRRDVSMGKMQTILKHKKNFSRSFKGFEWAGDEVIVSVCSGDEEFDGDKQYKFADLVKDGSTAHVRPYQHPSESVDDSHVDFDLCEDIDEYQHERQSREGKFSGGVIDSPRDRSNRDDVRSSNDDPRTCRQQQRRGEFKTHRSPVRDQPSHDDPGTSREQQRRSELKPRDSPVRNQPSHDDLRTSRLQQRHSEVKPRDSPVRDRAIHDDPRTSRQQKRHGDLRTSRQQHRRDDFHTRRGHVRDQHYTPPTQQIPGEVKPKQRASYPEKTSRQSPCSRDGQRRHSEQRFTDSNSPRTTSQRQTTQSSFAERKATGSRRDPGAESSNVRVYKALPVELIVIGAHQEKESQIRKILQHDNFKPTLRTIDRGVIMTFDSEDEADRFKSTLEDGKISVNDCSFVVEDEDKDEFRRRGVFTTNEDEPQTYDDLILVSDLRTSDYSIFSWKERLHDIKQLLDGCEAFEGRYAPFNTILIQCKSSVPEETLEDFKQKLKDTSYYSHHPETKVSRVQLTDRLLICGDRLKDDDDVETAVVNAAGRDQQPTHIHRINDRRAVVWFESYADVEDLMRSSALTKFYPYYDKFGIKEDSNTFRAIFEDIFEGSGEDHIWSYICELNQVKVLNNSLESLEAKADEFWASDKGVMKVSCTASLPPYFYHKWKSAVKEVFEDFKNCYDFKQIKFSKETIEQAEREASQFDEESKVIKQDTELIIVGNRGAVTSLISKLEKFREEHKPQRIQSEQNIRCRQAYQRLLKKMGVAEEMKRQYPDVNVVFHDDKITISGEKSEARKVKTFISGKRDQIEDDCREFKKVQQEFYNTKMKSDLERKLAGKHVVVEFTDGSIHAFGMSTEVVQEALDLVKGSVHYSESYLKPSQLDTTNTPAWETMLINAKQNYGDSFRIRIVDGHLELVCENSVFLSLKKDIDACFEREKADTHVVQLSPSMVDYLNSKKLHALTAIRRRFPTVTVQVLNEERAISLKGKMADVLEVKKDINAEVNLIRESAYTSKHDDARKMFVIDHQGILHDLAHEYDALLRAFEDKASFDEFTRKSQSYSGSNQEQGNYPFTIHFNNTKIELVEDSVSDVSSGAIVYEANRSLAVPGVLRDKAGDRLASECTVVKGPADRLDVGDVKLTRGYDLCDWILHAVCPTYDAEKSGRCLQTLGEILDKVLSNTSSKGIKELSMAPIGCDGRGYPHDTCINIIVRKVTEFIRTHPIDVIRFCATHDKLALFKRELESRLQHPHELSPGMPAREASRQVASRQEARRQVADRQASASPSPYSSASSYRKVADGQFTSVGKPTIQLFKGSSIADATEKAIIVSVNSKLNLDTGAVSKAIIKKAGDDVQKELKKNGGSTPVSDGTVIRTSAGKMKDVKYIYFLVLKRFVSLADEKALHDRILDIFEKASKDGCKSISCPALGTSPALNYPKMRAASALLGAALKHSETSTKLKDISFRIFGDEIYEKFEKQMLKFMKGDTETGDATQGASFDGRSGSSRAEGTTTRAQSSRSSAESKSVDMRNAKVIISITTDSDEKIKAIEDRLRETERGFNRED